jgi:hypothetical protein
MSAGTRPATVLIPAAAGSGVAFGLEAVVQINSQFFQGERKFEKSQASPDVQRVAV